MIIEKDSYLEFINLRYVFNGICQCLNNNTKSIRVAGINLLKTLYARVDDDLVDILKNLKG